MGAANRKRETEERGERKVQRAMVEKRGGWGDELQGRGKEKVRRRGGRGVAAPLERGRELRGNAPSVTRRRHCWGKAPSLWSAKREGTTMMEESQS